MKIHAALTRGAILSTTACALSLCVIPAVCSAAATDSPETFRYSTRVTDSAGRAIAGAVVEAYQYPEQGRSPGPELVTNLTTGTDGKFEVTLRTYTQIVVRKPGLAPSWREVSPNKTNDTPIALSPPTTLAGVVVDETGKPVSEAEVFVSVAHTGAKTNWTGFLRGKLTRQLFSSRTEADGQFRIEGFPANSLAELGVSTPGKVLPPRQVQYSPGSLLCHSGQHDIQLVVEPPAGVEGKVETETGEPVTNAWVELRSIGRTFAVPWESTRGITNGGFRFTGIASGAYQIFANFGTNEPPDWVAEPVPVTIRAGQNVLDIEVKVAKGAILQVRSIDKRTGKPVEQVYLTVHTGSDYLHQRSDRNGLALFRLMPRRYDVHGITQDGLLYQYASAQVDAGQTNEAILEFSPPPLVSGIVRDASGKPSSGLDVWSHPQRPKNDIKTDANGRYALVHNENPQVVLVVDSVHNMAVSRELEEGVTNLDLQLAPALTITGRVEDSQGRPIPKADAHVYLKSGDWGFPVYWQPVTADAQGAFRIINLPADRAYYVNSGATGYGSSQQKVPTDEGNRIELPPIVLRKADLKLMGRVVDPSDTPLANASIHVNGNGQPDIDSRTDSKGRFALEVCEGKVYFTVWMQDLQTSVTALAGDSNVVVVLKPRSVQSEPDKPTRASLIGKALPALATVNLPNDAAAPGQPLLLCLFDCEQRPSRQVLRLLTEQTESLRQKGVTILGIQTAIVTTESFDRWKESSPLPFKIGRITEKTIASVWASQADSLPWLILVNSQGRVAAEGFPLEDLAGKIGNLGE